GERLVTCLARLAPRRCTHDRCARLDRLRSHRRRHCQAAHARPRPRRHHHHDAARNRRRTRGWVRRTSSRVVRTERQRRLPDVGGWRDNPARTLSRRVRAQYSLTADRQSPNAIPSAFAVSSRSESSGTVFVRPTTSSSRRATMSGGAYATIVPNSPRLTSSTALPPKRVARTRSKLVGAPPRCRWPSTTDRVSFFVAV